MHNTEHLIELIRLAKVNKGITYSPLLGIKNPHFGYMVGFDKNELKVRALNPSIIKSYLTKYEEFFKNHNSYLGIWFNEDEKMYYIDCSQLIFDLDGAIKLGKARHQIAIYDNQNKLVINL